ncbi:hypothetical protein GCM10027456_13740 [Kineosporia babensis]
MRQSRIPDSPVRVQPVLTRAAIRAAYMYGRDAALNEGPESSETPDFDAFLPILSAWVAGELDG